MQEIRFSHSKEVVENYYRELYNSPLTEWRNTCNWCGNYRRGVFQLTTGEFKCVNCMALDKFHELVGMPEE